MTTCEFLHIKYTVALFSAFEVSVKKKKQHATCTIFSAFCTKPNDPCVANVHGNHYTSTYFILSSLVIISFSATLSLFGAGILEKKRVRVTAHYACVNMHNSRTISWSVINNDLSHLGGYICSIGLVQAVSESLLV